MIKLLNDKYGNPRYYISALELTEKQRKALREPLDAVERRQYDKIYAAMTNQPLN